MKLAFAQRLQRYLPLGLMLLALGLIGLGLWRGEAVLVLQKAVTICLECIGVG